jgi:2-keto-4-pentenoate hydratase
MTTAGGVLDGGGLKAMDMLVAARATGQPCAPVRGLLPDGDVDAAYAVQSARATSAPT